MDFSAAASLKGAERVGFTDRDIRTAFDQFDVDKNGYLGASDLANIFRSIGEELDDDMVREWACFACELTVTRRLMS